MCKKTTLWSLALLTGILLSHVDRAEGVVFGIRPPRTLCSSKLALQIRKWTLPNNDLGYSMKHAVPAYSVGGKHKTKYASISQTLGRTAIYATQGLGGLVGSFFGVTAWALILYHNPGKCPYYAIMLPMIGATAGTVSTSIILRQKGSCAGALIGSTCGWVLGIFSPPFSPGESGPNLIGFTAWGAVLGYHYKRLFEGNLSSKGELLIGSAIGVCAGLLLLEIRKLFL